jgi:acyl carrier protein
MTREEIRAVALEALVDIAPEAEPAGIEGDIPLQEQLDLDSLDFLRLLEELCDRTGQDIPERDYDQIVTLDGLVSYLAAERAGRD